MPLSKKRNRDRMRVIRSALESSSATRVQPNVMEAIESMVMPDYNDKFHCGELEIDADGQIIPEY